MTRALQAAFLSQAGAAAERCHLGPDELVEAALRMAASKAPAARLTRHELHLHLDAAIAGNPGIAGFEQAAEAVADAGQFPAMGGRVDG